MSIEIVVCPTRNHLKQIEDWLIAEHNNTGEGFYCNWGIIEGSYEEGKLYCVTSNDEAIGFAVWEQCDLIASLDIVEVRPDLRGRGIGKSLVEGCFKHFKSLGIFVVELECQPPTSERIWRRLGFRDIPEKKEMNYRKSIRLYRPLEAPLEANTNNEAIEVIELWDQDYWREDLQVATSNLPPTWTWSISRQEGMERLIQPIIHPCEKDWSLRWRKGDQVLKVSKVKYFSKESSDWGNYVIITKLPTEEIDH
jgi:GNAT superfamily N-acetyltransferase